jgi:ATP-binding cassette subfamily G (WHITE) protein 2 (SNQ2)
MVAEEAGVVSTNAKGSQQRLGITWTDLTVKGISSDSTINENVLSLWNFKNKFTENRGPPQLKTILDKSHGCVKAGEMLLVLGKPGSGCTSLLKILANRREGYAEIEGDVHYGSIHHSDAHDYSGQIVLNSEEEIFFPTLSVCCAIT